MSTPPRRSTLLIAAAMLAGFALLTALDGRIYHLVDPTLDSRRWLDGQWWYLALRNVGSLWTWLVVGFAVVAGELVRRVHVPGRAVWARGACISLSAAGGGLVAELLKLIVARERPATIQDLGGGVEALVYHGYRFRGLFGGFVDGSNLGLPSSHAATAAGGAFALALLWPRLWPLWLAPALGCALSRILTGAHFATDAFAGIVVGWFAAWAAGSVLRVRPRRGPAS